MRLPYLFGEWLPDLPALNNPGVLTALNVLPAARGYKPVKGLSPVGTALSGMARGAYGALDKTGQSYTYAGSAAKLYQISADATAEVTRASGEYTTAEDSYWEFAQFGQKIIATNFADDVQAITFGGSNFAALAGAPPKARHIAIVRDFVVLGNVNDSSDGQVPGRVHWSGFNDAESWTAGANQSDLQDLAGPGGWVQAILGGEFGIVFQEHAIWRMTYEGPPTIFRFDEVEPGRGTPAPGSIAQLGRAAFYLGHDGFYVFDGAQSVPIGASKVDASFWAEVDATYLHRISAAIDPENKTVLWAYPTGDSQGSGVPDKILAYQWQQGRWSKIALDVERLVSALSTGYRLEDLDSVSASLDALSASLDSALWTGGDKQLSAFDTDHKLASFTGANLAGTVDSAEAQLVPGRRSFVSAVRPIADGTVSVQLGARDRQQDAVSFGTASSPNELGEAPFLSDARFHRVRLNLSGDWSEAQGIDIEFTPSGAR